MGYPRIQSAIWGVAVVAVLAGGPVIAARAQGADQAMQGGASARKPVARRSAMKPHAAAKAEVLTPLTQRQRVEQVLDRFTFGTRPGEVDQVMAMGEDQWLDRQMNPGTIKDAVMDRRMKDLPTLAMTPLQAVSIFPDRQQVYAVGNGKAESPTDPLLASVYQVQIYKWDMEKDVKNADGTTTPRPQLTDAEKADKLAKDKATAARIAGELFALPKQERMAALIKMPVADRIAFTANGNLSGEQKNLLFSEFTPREQETFEAMSGNVSSSYYIGQELAQGRVLRDVLTERQMEQVMTEFWFNHFNIYFPKGADQWYTTAYERDVVRKHALGTFHDLLLATAQSPAMMIYLDNYLSIGPDSISNGVNPNNKKAKRGSRGLNENYGREVMELHTVGVNGGYSQADVTALSAILTGWGIDHPEMGGDFAFDPNRHEPGPKLWFGYVINEDGTSRKATPEELKSMKTFGPSETVATADSVKQGVAALDILAASPQTAHFISYLLAQYFVADNPPAALVDRLQKVYLSSGGDIKVILRALIDSPEFNSQQYFHNKVKTPEEFMASAFRATSTDPQNPGAMVNTIRTRGMELYHALPPTGYYLTADQWMNSTALVDRLNFAYQLTNDKFANQKFDAPKLLAMGLLAPAADFAAYAGGPKPVRAVPGAQSAKLMGVAASMNTSAPVAPPTQGAEVAKRVLEATMIGGPVSAQTNQLIDKQLELQKAGAGPTETLDLLTALVLGSPEFQMR